MWRRYKLKDILHDESFSKVEPIHKGWSNDKKYYVETKRGEKLLLRVSDISLYDEKKQEFDLMKRISGIGINMSIPIDFGVCNDGNNVYQLLTWVEGEEAKELLPSLSLKEQYDFGCEAGRMLLKMQTVESYPPSSDWAKIYGAKVRKYMETYKVCGEKMVGEELLISFIDEHFNCLDNRPMSLLHADFQSDNMIISPNKELYAIDFQGSGLIDPYYALTGVMVTAEVSPQFSIGQLHSYFSSHAPTDKEGIARFSRGQLHSYFSGHVPTDKEGIARFSRGQHNSYFSGHVPTDKEGVARFSRGQHNSYFSSDIPTDKEGTARFSREQHNSYFSGHVPDDFWMLNAFYMAAESINAFAVAVTLGREEVDYSNEMMKAMLDWFDNFNNLIPSWYVDSECL